MDLMQMYINEYHYIAVAGLKKDPVIEKMPITLDTIIGCVSEVIKVPVAGIKSKSRERRFVDGRKLVVYIARELTPFSLKTIARFLNLKDHTSVIHLAVSLKNLMDTEDQYKRFYDQAKSMIA